ncbi:hypothetical protein [Streptomyces sp. NL15-2K]|uniref:hypothetical protein n=1 Tax=Streptomyces sp. NL15-2K TaxID=376149 RepID=UPI000F55D2E8|nr:MULTISPECIES: hypothetical protein [Actinomycetes]WKX11946.1 hypothetical protein Q4V64_32315 [Kutzneria buriramensis]GCB53541.1 hypothetical protein SNL152K_10898 [Streptomyces sp. NL15-2K]
MERYFWHLNGAQTDGMACVVCGINFLTTKITSVPVGRSPADDSQVFACKDPCAVVIAHEAERMARQMRAAAGQDGAEELDVAECDDPVFSVDGHFGSLLRDLRTLAGAEALLATADDIPSLRFLLSLAARHAEAAMMRARLVLARTKEETKEGGE